MQKDRWFPTLQGAADPAVVTAIEHITKMVYAVEEKSVQAAEPAPSSDSSEIIIPGDIQPIGGAAFLLTQAEDGTTCRFEIEYAPPADMTGFAGVRAHWVRDGDNMPSASDDTDYNGVIVAGVGGHGTCVLAVPQDRNGDITGRVYLTSRSATYIKPLILAGNPGESPSLAATIHKATSSALIKPALPTSVTIAEKPNSRRLRLSDQTGWFTLQITVELPGNPVAGEWVSFWPSRDDKATWDGASLEFPITQQTQTFEVEYPIPEQDGTWWGKATTSSPSGFNVLADAVESVVGITVLGIQTPDAHGITGGTVTGPRYGVTDKGGVWGVTLGAVAAGTDPYAWFYFWTRQWVDENGNPDPNQPTLHGNEFRPGQTISDVGNLDQPLPIDPTYRFMRTQWWARNRILEDTLQADEFGPGVDYLDVEISTTAGDPPQDVEDFNVGTKQVDGTYLAQPEWDTLNERLLYDWGCYLPDDIRNMGGVGVWFKRPGVGVQWTLACKNADWIAPVAASPYEDTFAVGGSLVPKVPEEWTFRCVAANRFGAWKLNLDGTPAGPELTLFTLAPDKGITASNLNSGLLAAPISVINEQVAIIDKGIAEKYLADQAITARTMAQNAVTAANKALAALSVLDSNVDAVHIGKVIAGTVIFTGDVFMARGTNYPLVQLGYNGIYLWSAASVAGSSKGETATALGLTNKPYVNIASSSIGLYSGGSPAATITPSAITFWSESSVTAQPYAQLSSAGLVVKSGDFTSTFSAAQTKFSYGAGGNVYAALNSAQFKILNGTCSFVVTSQYLQLWAVDNDPSFPCVGVLADSVLITYGLAQTKITASAIEFGYRDPGNTAFTAVLRVGTSVMPTAYAELNNNGLKVFNLANTYNTQVYYNQVIITNTTNFSLASIWATTLYAQLILGKSDNANALIVSANTGEDPKITILGNQVLTKRQAGPGTPAGFADATAQAWCTSLNNALKAHGLIS